MAVYGYVRVSTMRQASEGESLDVQRRQIDGYALMHGLTIAETVIEEGISGSVPVTKRPAGSAMFAKLMSGDIIIAAKLDRLFRSAIDALNVQTELKAKGIKLHLIDLGGDIAGNGLSKLFFTIASAFAEAERDRIRERVTQSKADQRGRGRYLGGNRPFGYSISEDAGGGALVEVPSEQAAIRQIGALRDKGLSYRAIAGALASDGIALSHVAVKKILGRDRNVDR
ncbi:recombinase family protein [Mesorhizobium sp. ES1-4]|uniref:recombinase family protein n=1 Tax=Mesorhizobium sp. ES1-4 TaxID=2876627 RepID=UPI001CCA09B2|nr:recombinase family protein [Mesorhizobium sp. ES1-4]MBZ9795732.1 recombinase family protein [Mesorhizobium sp. ES1-4]